MRSCLRFLYPCLRFCFLVYDSFFWFLRISLSVSPHEGSDEGEKEGGTGVREMKEGLKGGKERNERSDGERGGKRVRSGQGMKEGGVAGQNISTVAIVSV